MLIYQKLFRFFLRKKRALEERFKRLTYILIGQVKLGNTTLISPKATLELNLNSNRQYLIELGEGTSIKDYARLCPRSGFIKIGKRCSVNPYCVLLGYGGITIGNNVRIASNTSIIAFQHNFENVDLNIIEQGNRCEGIEIGDDVWIGSGVRILDGVKIGKGAVIGAGSVVTKSLDENSVYVGIPAKKIKSRCLSDEG